MIEVQGNGNIVSREISVSTFIRLHLGCSGIVELHLSDEEKVVVEADENLQEFVAATNAGRTLYVSTEGTFRKPAFTSCIVKVYFRQLDTLLVRNDNGDVVCPKEIILSQPLEVKIQSVGNTRLDLVVPALKVLGMTEGNVTLKGKCEKLDIKNYAQGEFDSSQMIAGDVTLKNYAEGNVLLHADKSIAISHYGHGNVHFSGNGAVKDVKQYGHGVIKRVL